MAESVVGGIHPTQNDFMTTHAELWSPNSWLYRVASRNSALIFCLDTAFALIDGTKNPGHVKNDSPNVTFWVTGGQPPRTGSSGLGLPVLTGGRQ